MLEPAKVDRGGKGNEKFEQESNLGKTSAPPLSLTIAAGEGEDKVGQVARGKGFLSQKKTSGSHERKKKGSVGRDRKKLQCGDRRGVGSGRPSANWGGMS